MPLYKIDKYENFNRELETYYELSRKVITKMIGFINMYHNETHPFSPNTKLFIHIDFVDDLFSQVNFVMPPMGKFTDNGIVGKLSGTEVYISELLDEYEIFIGESEREIHKLKRNNKIIKILQR